LLDECPQSGFRGWDVLSFFVEGEGDCKCEIVFGQFNIFGAIEENAGHGFSRIRTDQKRD
jgi:hypothetical protein